MKHLFFLAISLLATLSSCRNCYEVYETKTVIYDVGHLGESATTDDTPLFETVDWEEENKRNFNRAPHLNYHIFNDDFSYSKTERGTEVIHRKSDRRFVKYLRKKIEVFEEETGYKKRAAMMGGSPWVKTGEKKRINNMMCDEYIGDQAGSTRPKLKTYINEDYPFTNYYQHPYSFPGFVMLKQGNNGSDGVFETTYDIKRVRRSKEFKRAIKEIKKLMKQNDKAQEN